MGMCRCREKGARGMWEPLSGFPWGKLSSSLATSITVVCTRQGQAKGRWETQREGLVYLREKGVPEAAPKGPFQIHHPAPSPHPARLA